VLDTHTPPVALPAVDSAADDSGTDYDAYAPLLPEVEPELGAAQIPFDSAADDFHFARGTDYMYSPLREVPLPPLAPSPLHSPPPSPLLPQYSEMS
jgi:hypothetical protein